MFDLVAEINNMLRAVTAPRTLVYPAYLASLIKRAVLPGDTEKVFTSVGAIETVGDCRYAMLFTDFNGTKYEVQVRVVNEKATEPAPANPDEVEG